MNANEREFLFCLFLSAKAECNALVSKTFGFEVRSRDYL